MDSHLDSEAQEGHDQWDSPEAQAQREALEQAELERICMRLLLQEGYKLTVNDDTVEIAIPVFDIRQAIKDQIALLNGILERL